MKLATRTFRKNRGSEGNQYYVTSPFGWRMDPITGEYKGHNGVDYGTHGNKWALYALEDGIVKSVYIDAWGAKCVRIAYPRLGIQLTYAHLDSICVCTGQSVNSDTIIGYTGTTGRSTGIHLHLGVQIIGDSMWVDPESIDYQENSEPAPTPISIGFPFDAIVKGGSALYNADGYKFRNGASCNRKVTVKGEVNGRYKIYGETFRPHEVYCDKESIISEQHIQSPYPFNGTIKKGSPLYNENGNQYKYGAQANRKVTVKGEVNGRYKIYGETFKPQIVYCDKESIIR